MKPSPLLPLVLFLATLPASAQWTQFGGPGRDFHAPAGRLAASWPDEGPPVRWRRELGDGYAEVLVDGERLFTLYRSDGHEVITALERATGDTLWEHAYPVVTTPSTQQFGDGPSGTPVIVGDRLVSAGIGIDVHCLDKRTGEVLWSRDLMEEHEIPMPGRGFSPSPLVHGGLVILPVGGRTEIVATTDAQPMGIRDGAIIALDLETGETVWARHDFPGSKASPILIEVAGRAQVVCFMGNELAGLDPATGELLWTFPHPTDFAFNCTTPVFDGVDTLVCTSAYNNQAEAIRIVPGGDGFAVEKLWESRRLRVHFTNTVLVDGRVYGISGMTRPGMLTCLDVGTGEAVWRARGFAKGNLVYAGGPWVILDEDGQLALATFGDDGPRIDGSLIVGESHVFAAPTLVGTDLYVRDRRWITAFDLSEEGVAALRAGEARAFVFGPDEIDPELEDVLGTYETDPPEEGGRATLLVDGGRLALELGDELFHLATVLDVADPDQDQGPLRPREFVEDRTSGSTPRKLEFVPDEQGLVYRFALSSPVVGRRIYWRIE